jgi:hypothetical protein
MTIHAKIAVARMTRPLRICRCATYSYVLIGGAVAEKNYQRKMNSRAG